MPRRARISLPEVPLHIIQRGNNRQACFHAEEDYCFYLDCLREYAIKTRCQVHAYVLMTNHVHLLATAAHAQGAGSWMKAVGQRYVQYVNRRYRRSVSLWEGRFRSCLTQEEGYLLACMRYIELNPVRAEMVAHPASSCAMAQKPGSVPCFPPSSVSFPVFPVLIPKVKRWMKSTTTWRGQTEGGRRAGYSFPRQSGKFASHCIAADSLRSPLNLSTGITDTHAVA